jgi:hypothetical protein
MFIDAFDTQPASQDNGTTPHTVIIRMNCYELFYALFCCLVDNIAIDNTNDECWANSNVWNSVLGVELFPSPLVICKETFTLLYLDNCKKKKKIVTYVFFCIDS